MEIDMIVDSFNNEECISFIKKVVEAFKKAIDNVASFFIKIIKSIRLTNPKYIGLRRIMKSSKIEYYKSISEGKSNNWRRLHDLPLVRRC